MGLPVTTEELVNAVTVGDDGSVERVDDSIDSPAPAALSPQTTSIAMALPAARLFGT